MEILNMVDKETLISLIKSLKCIECKEFAKNPKLCE